MSAWARGTGPVPARGHALTHSHLGGAGRDLRLLEATRLARMLAFEMRHPPARWTFPPAHRTMGWGLAQRWPEEVQVEGCSLTLLRPCSERAHHFGGRCKQQLLKDKPPFAGAQGWLQANSAYLMGRELTPSTAALGLSF